jgi:hypothetical protein
MRLTWRDGLATLFVVGAAAVYGVWVAGAGTSGTSTRVIGAIVFGLGWAACTSNKDRIIGVYGAAPGRPHAPMAYIVASSVVGLTALVAGILTLVSASETTLVILVAAMIALWALSTLRHQTASRRADATSGWHTAQTKAAWALVEVAGIEPASLSDLPSLLRA